MLSPFTPVLKAAHENNGGTSAHCFTKGSSLADRMQGIWCFETATTREQDTAKTCYARHYDNRGVPRKPIPAGGSEAHDADLQAHQAASGCCKV